MVAFPDLENEPTILNVNKLQSGEHMRYSDGFEKIGDIVVDLNAAMERDSDIYASHQGEIGYDGKFINAMGSTKLDFADSLNADNAIVKKVAAGLRLPDDILSCEKGAATPNIDGNSLSSGGSIVTITSLSNSDPDPDYSVGSPETPKKRKLVTDERWHETFFQVAIPFLIAGLGTIGAGIVLDNVQHWDVYSKVTQLFILVPALLGLKGNLDMCLASRLSTQANLGNLSSIREILKMILGNLAVVQIQGIVAATLVSFFAMTVNAIKNGEFNWNHSLLLIASSISTATSSCFILDIVMIAIILFSHRFKLNPDNLATPIAASVGDVVSLTVLSLIASSLFHYIENQIWVLYVIILAYLILLPIWILIVLRNKYTRHVLTSGWTPVLSALFISGLGGLILDQAVNVLNGFVIFQPIINGIGGNLVSVQASRISTMLHQSSIMGIIPPHTKMLVSPLKALLSGVPSARTARILILMSVPGHIIFMFVADYMAQDRTTIHVFFVFSYLIVASLQIMILLYIAHIMIHAMWKYKIDPDNSAIPYLTALGDLTGSLFLAGAFWFLKSIGHEYGI